MCSSMISNSERHFVEWLNIENCEGKNKSFADEVMWATSANWIHAYLWIQA